MSFKVKLNQLTSKRVPAVSLIIMASAGMIVGVLAASITVNQSSRTGAGGNFYNNTGGITFTDNGLSVVNSAIASNSSSSFTWGATGTNKQIYNTMTVGHLMDTLVFSTTLTDSSTHIVTIRLYQNDGSASGSNFLTVTAGTWTMPGSSSTANITVYIDTGLTSITAPMTIYVSVP